MKTPLLKTHLPKLANWLKFLKIGAFIATGLLILAVTTMGMKFLLEALLYTPILHIIKLIPIMGLYFFVIILSVWQQALLPYFEPVRGRLRWFKIAVITLFWSLLFSWITLVIIRVHYPDMIVQ